MDLDTDISALYVAHAPGLTRWMTSITRDPDLAADLVQEAFLRLARELEAGRKPDNCAAWLAQVSRNLAISRARHVATATRLEDRLSAPPAAADPAVAALEAERTRAVHAALAELRPAARTALVLAAEGHRNAEIAARIGRSELATRALMCRARRQLRPVLQGIAAV